MYLEISDSLCQPSWLTFFTRADSRVILVSLPGLGDSWFLRGLLGLVPTSFTRMDRAIEDLYELIQTNWFGGWRGNNNVEVGDHGKNLEDVVFESEEARSADWSYSSSGEGTPSLCSQLTTQHFWKNFIYRVKIMQKYKTKYTFIYLAWQVPSLYSLDGDR